MTFIQFINKSNYCFPSIFSSFIESLFSSIFERVSNVFETKTYRGNSQLVINKILYKEIEAEIKKDAIDNDSKPLKTLTNNLPTLNDRMKNVIFTHQ